MTQRGPLRSQQSYRHEALLWHTAEDFTDALVAFVDEGLDAGEPVMVAVTPQHTAWLQEALGDAAAQEVQFVDMMSLGRNPARIIPAWREFVDAESAGHGPVRGIGEPIWPGRHAEELLECQLHEALLNVAIEPATPLWLICPYDAASLDPEVLEEARGAIRCWWRPARIAAAPTTPVARTPTHCSAPVSASRADAPEWPATPRRPSTGCSRTRSWSCGSPGCRRSGRPSSPRPPSCWPAAACTAARPRSSIRIWSDPDAVVCEVSDDAPVTDPLHGRSLPTDEHEGLWQVNQACDLVQLRSAEGRTTVRILTWKQ